MNWTSTLFSHYFHTIFTLFLYMSSPCRALWEDICHLEAVLEQSCAEGWLASHCGWWHTHQVTGTRDSSTKLNYLSKGIICSCVIFLSLCKDPAHRFYRLATRWIIMMFGFMKQNYKGVNYWQDGEGDFTLYLPTQSEKIMFADVRDQQPYTKYFNRF